MIGVCRRSRLCPLNRDVEERLGGKREKVRSLVAASKLRKGLSGSVTTAPVAPAKDPDPEQPAAAPVVHALPVPVGDEEEELREFSLTITRTNANVQVSTYRRVAAFLQDKVISEYWRVLLSDFHSFAFQTVAMVIAMEKGPRKGQLHIQGDLKSCKNHTKNELRLHTSSSQGVFRGAIAASGRPFNAFRQDLKDAAGFMKADGHQVTLKAFSKTQTWELMTGLLRSCGVNKYIVRIINNFCACRLLRQGPWQWFVLIAKQCNLHEHHSYVFGSGLWCGAGHFIATVKDITADELKANAARYSVTSCNPFKGKHLFTKTRVRLRVVTNQLYI